MLHLIEKFEFADFAGLLQRTNRVDLFPHLSGRRKQEKTPKNLAEAISIESGELLENFLWRTHTESKNLNQAEKESIDQEVADIFIYLIYLCEELNIDMYDKRPKS